MKTQIEQLLKQKLTASYVQVIDDSDRHKGHPGAAPSGNTHFSVLVVSDQFEGKSLAQRHRMIYGVLMNQIRQGLHALAIKAYTTKEYKN
jgi:BolA protein